MYMHIKNVSPQIKLRLKTYLYLHSIVPTCAVVSVYAITIDVKPLGNDVLCGIMCAVICTTQSNTPNVD